MQLLIEYIEKSLPFQKSLLPDLIKPYYTFSDELTVINGLIFKCNRLVVPKALRKEMLSKIHYHHLGIEKCKNGAREV